MKLTTLLLVASLFHVKASTYSQNAKISLDLQRVDIMTVLEAIENQSEFKFLGNEDVLDAFNLVSVKAKKERIGPVLDRLFAGTDVTYQVQDRQIILSRTTAGDKTTGPVKQVNTNPDPPVQLIVSGTVMDKDGMPLPGTSVVEAGTTNGTQTDFDGKYSLTVEGDTPSLIFSYIGFASQTVAVAGKSTIDVILQESAAGLDEVVVVGYGTQKKVTVTGAVVGVKGEVLEESPSVNLSNSLAGRLPGVVAVQSSGEPGFDGSTINIRGSNTLGDNSPLIVIDGIPDRAGGLDRLSPQDIESMTVLKDASAAIYGARAANGVILIVTKRGGSAVDRKPTVTYDANFGIQQPTQIPDMSNAVQYANIMNELPIYQNIPVNEWGAAWNSISSTGTYDSPTANVPTLNANYSPEAIQKHADGSDPWGYPDTDWFDDTFTTWAPQQQHNIQIAGSTDRVNYLTSIGYLDQDAYYKNTATKYQQYNVRLNLDTEINDYIKVGVGAMYRKEVRKFPTESAGNIFRMLMRGRPTEPAVWPNGLPGPDIENGQNPVVVTTNATGYDEQPLDFLQLNGTVDVKFPWVEGLKMTLMGAVDQTFERRKLWQTPWTLYYWDRTSYEQDGVTPKLEGAIRSNFTDPRLRQESNYMINTNLTAMFNYDRTFAEHHSVNIMAGVTHEEFKGSDFYAFRRNYLSSAVDQLFAGGSLNQDTGGSGYERARLGYYGRFQYNFKEKYLAEFIWRYDGSYMFPEQDRFGFFPGVLLGWNISNEDFFDVNGIDYLKLRASYGQMGNDQVFYNDQLQEYAYLDTYGFEEYPINGIVETTLNETVLANPSFTWERANNFNVGLDGTFFGHLNLTLEYFYNKRDQILIQKTGSTPASSGISNLLPPVNQGEVNNQGFEFAADYFGGNEFQYSFGVNGGYAKNEVIFMDEIPGAPEYQHQEGKPIGAYLVYESDGVFFDEAEIASNTLDYSEVTSQLLPGDMKFKDINNDGVINGDDRVRIEENLTPTFNFGANMDFAYKGFSLNILFQGATGASLRIQTESGDIGNYLEYSHNNRWSIDSPSREHPRLASRGDTYFTGGNYGNNTYFLFSKDYIRLKNAQLAYTFPTAWIDDFGISGFRVYVSGLNLITWDKYGIFDPESEAGSGVYYPQARVINTGFSITF